MNGSAGFYDPLVDTGRGSWVLFSRTSLEKLLEQYDRAYPKFTSSSRAYVINGWKEAEVVFRNSNRLGAVA